MLELAWAWLRKSTKLRPVCAVSQPRIERDLPRIQVARVIAKAGGSERERGGDHVHKCSHFLE
jgi:hypothetical protein